MVYGLWSMVYGLWSMVYGFCYAVSINGRLFSVQIQQKYSIIDLTLKLIYKNLFVKLNN